MAPFFGFDNLLYFVPVLRHKTSGVWTGTSSSYMSWVWITRHGSWQIVRRPGKARKNVSMSLPVLAVSSSFVFNGKSTLGRDFLWQRRFRRPEKLRRFGWSLQLRGLESLISQWWMDLVHSFSVGSRQLVLNVFWCVLFSALQTLESKCQQWEKLGGPGKVVMQVLLFVLRLRAAKSCGDLISYYLFSCAYQLLHIVQQKPVKMPMLLPPPGTPGLFLSFCSTWWFRSTYNCILCAQAISTFATGCASFLVATRQTCRDLFSLNLKVRVILWMVWRNAVIPVSVSRREFPKSFKSGVTSSIMFYCSHYYGSCKSWWLIFQKLKRTQRKSIRKFYSAAQRVVAFMPSWVVTSHLLVFPLLGKTSIPVSQKNFLERPESTN